MNKLQYLITTVVTPLMLAIAFTSPSIHADIVAQYHFDESSGTTAFDSAGTFDGTLSNTGATFVSGGISGNAISLDRALNGLVNMGTSFPGFTSGDFSLVLWVNTTTTQIDTIPLAKHEAFSQNGYLIAVNQTGGGGALNKTTFTAGSEFVSQSPTSTSSVNDGGWHQIVGVFNAGGTHSIYVDGSPAEASTASQTILSNNAAFLIGGVNQSGTPNARYTGLVDEVQVYDQALTNDEIDFLFLNPAQIIPEPATWAMMVLGSCGLFAARRLRRRS